MPAPNLPVDLDEFLAGHTQELIGFRRDLHAHPEIAHAERRTTAKVAQRLTAAARWWRCGPTWTPWPSPMRSTWHTGPPSLTSATPAGTTCTPRCWWARGCTWPTGRTGGCCPAG